VFHAKGAKILTAKSAKKKSEHELYELIRIRRIKNNSEDSEIYSGVGERLFEEEGV